MTNSDLTHTFEYHGPDTRISRRLNVWKGAVKLLEI